MATQVADRFVFASFAIEIYEIRYPAAVCQ